MRGILYVIAGILFAGWAYGYFIGDAGAPIHILLVIALAALLIGIFRKDTAG
ncbi:MAG: lmo0937 family membrane protein [Bacteroidetes bacterium]|nr:lmo0937 family membrane protein [Bacteroidota bacterium]MBS1629912.1 lmo0937 family membrane protein [Bacteroidota bacterium]